MTNTNSKASETAGLDANTFDAQRYAHRLLREATKADAPRVLRGVRVPNKSGAHIRLTADADIIGMPLDHPRVELVRWWIDISSGVAE